MARSSRTVTSAGVDIGINVKGQPARQELKALRNEIATFARDINKTLSTANTLKAPKLGKDWDNLEAEIKRRAERIAQITKALNVTLGAGVTPRGGTGVPGTGSSQTAKEIAAIVRESKALSAIRVAEERAQQQTNKTLVEEARLRKATADAIKAETAAQRALNQEQARQNRATNASPFDGFKRAIYSSRFALPGTNGNVMPLVGQVARGGAGAMLGLGAMAVAGGISTGIREGVNEAADLEKAMMKLQGRTQATTAQLKELSDTARKLGADITLPSVSSTDAARALETLSVRGLSLKESMDAAKGALQLAAIAEVEAAKGAEMVTDALHLFNLEGSEAGRVADVLAAGSKASGARIIDLSEALSNVGPIANNVGLSLETTVGLLSQLDRAGLKGAEAGTNLKVALMRLYDPARNAALILNKVGVAAFDGDHKAREFADVLNDLTKATGKLTDQERLHMIGTVMGERAALGLNILIKQNTTAFNDMQVAVRKSGVAGELTEAQMRGLRGALEGFDSVLRSLLERSASESGLVGLLTDIVHWGSEAVGQLDKVIQEVMRLQNEGKNTGLPTWMQNILDASEVIRLNLRTAAAGTGNDGEVQRATQDISDLRDLRKGQVPPGKTLLDGLKGPLLNDYLRKYNVPLPSPLAGQAEVNKAIDQAIQAAMTIRSKALDGRREEVEMPRRTPGVLPGYDQIMRGRQGFAKVTDYGQRKDKGAPFNDPYVVDDKGNIKDHNTYNGIGNRNNSLSPMRSVAVSPDVAKILKSQGFKMGDNIEFQLQNGKTFVGRWDDTTADNLKGGRIDVYNPYGQGKGGHVDYLDSPVVGAKRGASAKLSPYDTDKPNKPTLNARALRMQGVDRTGLIQAGMASENAEETFRTALRNYGDRDTSGALYNQQTEAQRKATLQGLMGLANLVHKRELEELKAQEAERVTQRRRALVMSFMQEGLQQKAAEEKAQRIIAQGQDTELKNIRAETIRQEQRLNNEHSARYRSITEAEDRVQKQALELRKKAMAEADENARSDQEMKAVQMRRLADAAEKAIQEARNDPQKALGLISSAYGTTDANVRSTTGALFNATPDVRKRPDLVGTLYGAKGLSALSEYDRSIETARAEDRRQGKNPDAGEQSPEGSRLRKEAYQALKFALEDIDRDRVRVAKELGLELAQSDYQLHQKQVENIQDIFLRFQRVLELNKEYLSLLEKQGQTQEYIDAERERLANEERIQQGVVAGTRGSRTLIDAATGNLPGIKVTDAMASVMRDFTTELQGASGDNVNGVVNKQLKMIRDSVAIATALKNADEEKARILGMPAGTNPALLSRISPDTARALQGSPMLRDFLLKQEGARAGLGTGYRGVGTGEVQFDGQAEFDLKSVLPLIISMQKAVKEGNGTPDQLVAFYKEVADTMMSTMEARLKEMDALKGSDRQGAFNATIAGVYGGADFAGLDEFAKAEIINRIIAERDKNPGSEKSRVQTAGEDIVMNLREGIDRAVAQQGGDVLGALFTRGDKHQERVNEAAKRFWLTIAAQGQQALAEGLNVLVLKPATNRLTNGIKNAFGAGAEDFDRVLSKATQSFGKTMQAGAGAVLQTANYLLGVLTLSGQQGKKAQKGGIMGAVLGVGLGLATGGTGLALLGAGLSGASAGGQAANGNWLGAAVSLGTGFMGGKSFGSMPAPKTAASVPTGPPRAGGGMVHAGIAYPVGENGVEWFMPSTAGNIVPHSSRMAVPLSRVAEANPGMDSLMQMITALTVNADHTGSASFTYNDYGNKASNYDPQTGGRQFARALRDSMRRKT